MAAQMQQLQNQLNQTQPTLRIALGIVITGIPTITWYKTRQIVLTKLGANRVGGTLDARSVATGAAAGNPHAAGAAPAAAIVAIFTAGSLQTYALLVEAIPSTTQLYIDLQQPPFFNDAVLTWAHIDWFMQKQPEPEDISAFHAEFDGLTFMNSIQLSRTAMHDWLNFLVDVNNEKPPGMRRTEVDVLRRFCYFIHPQIADKASDIFDNNAIAFQFPAVYPAVITPGSIYAHPQAGNAHPNAGQRDRNLIVKHLNVQWNKLIDRGAVIIPPPVNVNQLSAMTNFTPENANHTQHFEGASPNTGANHEDPLTLTVSIYALLEHGFSVEQIRSINRRSKFPRCFGCGGVNHFAKKDGKWICPTPQNSVPQSILFNIQYPAEVIQPPSGKGKGKGRGGRFNGRGRGRGVNNVDYLQMLLALADDEDDTGGMAHAPTENRGGDRTHATRSLDVAGIRTPGTSRREGKKKRGGR